MAEQTKSSMIETSKMIKEEQKAIEKELNNLKTTDEEEELKKNATIVDGENLEKATSASEGLDDMKKVIKLIASDDVIFKVDLSIVKEMEIVQSFLDSSESDNFAPIPLPNVTSRCLGLIIKYSENHYRLFEARNFGELKEFKKQFIEERNCDDLKELLLAANYLHMKNFFEFICNSLANKIKNKSVSFMRDLFGLTSDYTPEEELEYRQLNSWAFQNLDQD